MTTNTETTNQETKMKTQSIMKKNQVSFSLNRRRDGEYYLLDVEFWQGEQYGERLLGKVRYQAGADKPHDWYAGDFETNTKGLRDLGEVVAALKRALGDIRFYGNAVEVLRKLASLPQTVNDARTGKRVGIGEVLPTEYVSYRDDYNRVAYGSSGCTVGCVARDDDEARRLLTVEFCRDRHGEYYKERFEQWLAAGRPVLRLRDGWRYPSFTPLAEVLAEIDAAQAPAEAQEQAA